MSDLDRLVLGTLMASFAGTHLPEEVAGMAAGGLGSVCLFGSNLTVDPMDDAVGEDAVAEPGDARARALSDAVHGLGPDCLVATDEEGGDVTRLDTAVGSAVPGAATLGAAGDPDLTGAVTGVLARRLRAAGIDLALAPVLDVNVAADNPIIGSRSFGTAPAEVAAHGVAAVRALQAAGLAACAKHFPGHGAVTEDSHHVVPRVDVDLATLRRRELVPFAAAVEAGVAAVMTGHLLVPAIDPRQPVTTSPAAVRLLRRDLGFAGVVVTDALDMAGVSGPGAHGSVGAAAVAALAAGADLLCLGAEAADRGLLAEARAAVTLAVRDRVLPLARLEEAAARVADLGRRAREVRANATASQGSPGPDDAVMRAAHAALRLDGELPDLRGAVVARVVDVPTIAAGPVPWDLAGPLAGLVPGVTAVDVPATPGGAEAAPARAAGRPLVVLARDLDRAPAVRSVVAGILAARPDAVLVDAGWPSTGLPAGVTVLRTHGSSRPSLRAAAEHLAAGSRTAGLGAVGAAR